MRATTSESPSPIASSDSQPHHFKIPKRMLLAVFLITVTVVSVLLVFQFVPATHATSEYENLGPYTSDSQVYNVGWRAENFTVGATSHTVTKIALYLHNCPYISTQTSTVSIRSTLTGADLTSGTIANSGTTLSFAWYNISVTEITVSANTKYYIVFRDPNDDASANYYMDWGQSSSGTGSDYSPDSGNTWYTGQHDMSYQIWGNSLTTYPPTYTTIGSNETIAGNIVNCYCLWAANGTAISGFIFSTDNGSASYTNQTWTSSMPSGWGNYTFTLNVTVGTVIHWKEYCNDTANDWNTTSVQTITTTYYASITVNTSTHSWSLNPGSNNVTITENSGKISLTVTSNAAFDIQAKASAALAYGPYSIALTNTNMSASTWTAAIPLTTSYQIVPGLSNVAGGTGLSESFYLWLSCPTNEPAGAYTYTLTVEVTQH